jgi:hypothetical protein
LAAVKSTGRNVHGVLASDHRRGVEVEGYAKITIDDDIVVRWDSINGEITRLDSGWVCGITKIDREIRWRSADNNASTDGAGHRTTCSR